MERKSIIALFATAFLLMTSLPVYATQFKGTILFENGSGVNLKEWTQNKDFTACAKQYGRLFLYDRLTPVKPLTPNNVNAYLMIQLKQRKIKPPYILVAHSYGAMYSMYFARKYPDLVKGILLVDPVPNNFEWQNSIKKEKNK
ncbi:MAG TPA: alpha/beta hydrolase, partial [Gammaproteobacteria bacterium]|nr:alpha/beta hydrolase [Gammaproteobacteria bacterium]